MTAFPELMSAPSQPPARGETVHDRRITVDGVETQYLEADAGPLALLLHRHEQSATSWRWVIMFCLRRSPWPRKRRGRGRRQGGQRVAWARPSRAFAPAAPLPRGPAVSRASAVVAYRPGVRSRYRASSRQ
jgi:hypothetical protein